MGLHRIFFGSSNTPADPLSRAERMYRLIACGVVLSGCLLLPLLSIGMTRGVTVPLFQLAFQLHLIAHTAVTALALMFYGQLCRRAEWTRILTLGVPLMLFAMIVMLGVLPPTNHDALVHHLAVPRWWIAAGSVHKIAWHEWSFYPMLLQLAFTGFLQNNAEWAIAPYHATYLILLAALVAAVCLEKGRSPRAGVLGFLFTITLPLSMKLASAQLVDLGLALYFMVALSFLLRWNDEGRRPVHAALAGVALGLALGTKYNGLLGVALLFPILVIYGQQAEVRLSRLLSLLAWSGCFAFLVFLPWITKNIIWAGNPVFPLMKGFFGGPALDAALPGLKPITHRFALYGESWTDVVLIPLRMLFFGEDGNPRLFDGVLSPVMLLGLVPLLRVRREPWAVLFYLFSFAYLLFALTLSAARARYLTPILGPWLCLTGLGTWHFIGMLSGNAKRLALGLIATGTIAFACWYGSTLCVKSAPLAYLQGEESREAFLLRNHPEYAAIQYANTQLPHDAYIYLLYTGNSFYLYQGKVLSSGYNSAARIVSWLRNSSDIQREVRAARIRYFLLHDKRTVEGLRGLLTSEELQNWDLFVQRSLRQKFAANGFSIWEVIQDPGALPPQPTLPE